MPDLDEKPDDPGPGEGDEMGDSLTSKIQEAINEYQGDLGPQLLGDWVIGLEVHTGEGQAFRYISNCSSWRSFGLLAAAKMQVETELSMRIYENLPGDDDDD